MKLNIKSDNLFHFFSCVYEMNISAMAWVGFVLTIHVHCKVEEMKIQVLRNIAFVSVLFGL